VSFLRGLCDMMLASAVLPPSDLDSTAGSLKRKHVSSSLSLSEIDQAMADSSSNGSRLTQPGVVSEEDSSSSSLSACSSDLPVFDDLLPEQTSSVQPIFHCSFKPELNYETSSGDTRSETSQDFLESRLNQNVVAAAGGWMMCPNMSLAMEQDVARSVSGMSSMQSSVDDADDPAARLSANMLVVSHGGFISQLLGHFADDFDCCLPGGVKIASTVTPNAGLSRFLVTVSRSEDMDRTESRSEDVDRTERDCAAVCVRCVALHDKDHLANDIDVEPLPTSAPL